MGNNNKSGDRKDFLLKPYALKKLSGHDVADMDDIHESTLPSQQTTFASSVDIITLSQFRYETAFEIAMSEFFFDTESVMLADVNARVAENLYQFDDMEPCVQVTDTGLMVVIDTNVIDEAAILYTAHLVANLPNRTMGFIWYYLEDL